MTTKPYLNRIVCHRNRLEWKSVTDCKLGRELIRVKRFDNFLLQFHRTSGRSSDRSRRIDALPDVLDDAFDGHKLLHLDA